MAPTFALPVPPNRPFSGADMAWLLARGDWLFATGDVASARFLYERGVDAICVTRICAVCAGIGVRLYSGIIVPETLVPPRLLIGWRGSKQ